MFKTLCQMPEDLLEFDHWNKSSATTFRVSIVHGAKVKDNSNRTTIIQLPQC